MPSIVSHLTLGEDEGLREGYDDGVAVETLLQVITVHLLISSKVYGMRGDIDCEWSHSF